MKMKKMKKNKEMPKGKSKPMSGCKMGLKTPMATKGK
jgi:hypothetical protein